MGTGFKKKVLPDSFEPEGAAKSAKRPTIRDSSRFETAPNFAPSNKQTTRRLMQNNVVKKQKNGEPTFPLGVMNTEPKFEKETVEFFSTFFKRSRRGRHRGSAAFDFGCFFPHFFVFFSADEDINPVSPDERWADTVFLSGFVLCTARSLRAVL